jgi:hypothetical protein
VRIAHIEGRHFALKSDGIYFKVFAIPLRFVTIPHVMRPETEINPKSLTLASSLGRPKGRPKLESLALPLTPC